METADASEKTRADTEEFVSEFNQFLGLINNFTDQASNLAEQVKKRKVEAIGTRTHLQALSRENKLKKSQLIQKIEESHLLLERLRGEHDALRKIEQDQNSTLAQFNG